LEVLKTSASFIRQESHFLPKLRQLPIQNGIIDYSEGTTNFVNDDGKTVFFDRINVSFNKAYIDEGLPELFMRIIKNGLTDPDISPKINQERIECFLDCLAYTLIPGNRCCKLFIIYGASQAGKSKLMEILGAVFGTLGVPIEASTIINHSRANPELRPDLYRLYDKLFISASETEKAKKLDSRVLKNMSGGDKASVRTLHSDQFGDSKIIANIFIVSNFEPQFTDPKDPAIRERVVAIK
jgi:phage/plasmid-associated DNA primase